MYEYAEWTGWQFSHLKTFTAENAETALAMAAKYISEIYSGSSRAQVRNIRKI
jgi:hypothetical protein